MIVFLNIEATHERVSTFFSFVAFLTIFFKKTRSDEIICLKTRKFTVSVSAIELWFSLASSITMVRDKFQSKFSF